MCDPARFLARLLVHLFQLRLLFQFLLLHLHMHILPARVRLSARPLAFLCLRSRRRMYEPARFLARLLVFVHPFQLRLLSRPLLLQSLRLLQRSLRVLLTRARFLARLRRRMHLPARFLTRLLVHLLQLCLLFQFLLLHLHILPARARLSARPLACLCLRLRVRFWLRCAVLGVFSHLLLKVSVRNAARDARCVSTRHGYR